MKDRRTSAPTEAPVQDLGPFHQRLEPGRNARR
jgi:hypothetical protein